MNFTLCKLYLNKPDLKKKKIRLLQAPGAD